MRCAKDTLKFNLWFLKNYITKLASSEQMSMHN